MQVLEAASGMCALEIIAAAPEIAAVVCDYRGRRRMRSAGFEPAWGFPHRLLRPTCMPVPPRPRVGEYTSSRAG
jgi:hypothetical protein